MSSWVGVAGRAALHLVDSIDRSLRGEGDDRISEWTGTLLAFLLYLPVALGSLLWLFLLGGEWGLVTHTVGEAAARDAAVGVGVGGLCFIGVHQAATRSAAVGRVARRYAASLGRLSAPSTLIVTASAAIAEELLFRGVLAAHIGAIASAALFGVAHLPLERRLWQLVPASFAIGLVLSALEGWTDALVAPAAAHFTLEASVWLWLGRWASTAR